MAPRTISPAPIPSRIFSFSPGNVMALERVPKRLHRLRRTPGNQFLQHNENQ